MRIDLNSIDIVGGKYRPKEQLATVAVHDAVVFLAEPDNPYDPFAIKAISSRNKHIGYLPAKIARHLSPLIKEGFTLTGEILTFDRKAVRITSSLLLDIPLEFDEFEGYDDEEEEGDENGTAS